MWDSLTRLLFVWVVGKTFFFQAFQTESYREVTLDFLHKRSNKLILLIDWWNRAHKWSCLKTLYICEWDLYPKLFCCFTEAVVHFVFQFFLNWEKYIKANILAWIACRMKIGYFFSYSVVIHFVYCFFTVHSSSLKMLFVEVFWRHQNSR